MAIWFLLIFLGLPVIEIALFIKVGGAIGVLPTIGLVILMAVAGTALVRWQGLQALDRLRASIEAGRDPAGPIAHGALILVAGMLMVLPGFFTDAVGILLLIPAVRALLIRWGAARLTARATNFTYVRRTTGPTIEADYEVLEEHPRRGGSGWTRPQ